MAKWRIDVLLQNLPAGWSFVPFAEGWLNASITRAANSDVARR
jgi:hypothetical protein